MGNLTDDVMGDLVTTNELGDGSRDYREVDGVLFLDFYDDDTLDESGMPVPSRTFRVDITITEVDA